MLDGDVCRWIKFAKSVQMEKYYHFKKGIILFQNSMKTNKLSNAAGPTQASLIIWSCVCACSINPFFSKVKSFPTHFVIMQRLNVRIPCSKRSLCAKQLKKQGIELTGLTEWILLEKTSRPVPAYVPHYNNFLCSTFQWCWEKLSKSVFKQVFKDFPQISSSLLYALLDIRIIKAPKQSTKLVISFWMTFLNIKLITWYGKSSR